MKFLGVSVGPEADFSIALLRQMGATMCRITPRPGRDIAPYLRELRQNGITPLLCLDRASLGESIEDLAGQYGHLCTYWSLLNEADDRGQESSYADPRELSLLLSVARSVLPTAYLIAGGFSTGQPSYVEQVDLTPADAVGVHGYGQRPNNAEDWSFVPGNFGYIGDLFGAYARFHQPLWSDEIGIGSVTAVQQADYCRAMLLELDALGVEGAVWYCGKDWDSRRLGLLDQDGNQKPALAAFADAARLIVGAQPAPPPIPVPQPAPEPTMPSFQEGFAVFHAAMPDVIGDPIRDEFGAYPGQSSQPTKKGVLVWTKGMGMAYYARNGRVWRWADGAAQPEEVVA